MKLVLDPSTKGIAHITRNRPSTRSAVLAFSANGCIMATSTTL
nr:MAG TPA: hypothetical protein [Caudoviricetes sp.]